MSNAPSTSVDLYLELPQISQTKGQRLKLTTSAPFTPTYVQSQLPPSSDPPTVYASRLEGRQIVLENPARVSRAKQLANQRKARQARDVARKKAHVIGRKEAALRGIWDLKEAETRKVSYELFLPLHQLWKSYMAELLGLPPRPQNPIDPTAVRMPNTQSMQTKLVKADFHGSFVSVRSAKNPCLIGCAGIVIHETENTFKVINVKDTLKVIPKKNSVFVFTVPLYAPPQETDGADPSDPMMEFELYGNQFAFRSSDRATRKFKHKVM